MATTCGQGTTIRSQSRSRVRARCTVVDGVAVTSDDDTRLHVALYADAPRPSCYRLCPLGDGFRARRGGAQAPQPLPEA